MIGHEKYRKYLEDGIYGCLPKIFMRDFKPKILGNLIIEEHVLGDFVGINTRAMDFSNENKIDKYLNSILSLKQNYEYIYMEDFDLRLYNHIKSKLDIKFKSGKNIRMYNIAMVLNEVLKYKKEKYKEEILILCEDCDLVYELICFISQDFKFISLLGINKYEIEELYNKIFKEIGTPIFLPKDIKKNFKSTKILINFKEELDEDLIYKFKYLNNDAILIDFSLNKPLLEIEGLEIITDLVFDLSKDMLKDNHLMDSEIRSILYESLYENKIEKFSKLLINASQVKECKVPKNIIIKGVL